MDIKTESSIQFNSFIQWLCKNDRIQFDAYNLTAIVSYETDNDNYSFYNKELRLIVTKDSQKIGSVEFPDLDFNDYFPGYDVPWQKFTSDEKKEELIIESIKKTNVKKYSAYTITIRNIKKTM